MDNSYFYNKWRNVPTEALKAFNNGTFSGTDINAMWRIQVLTEQFGPCGIGWYYTIDKQWLETVGNCIKAFCNVSLYIKVNGEWSMPIQGTGGNVFAQQGKNSYKISDECYKMALTDALSISCKALGIGADVWFAEGKSKYTTSIEEYETIDETGKPGEPTKKKASKAKEAEKPIEKPQAENPIEEALNEAEKAVEEAGDLAALTDVWNKYRTTQFKTARFVKMVTEKNHLFTDKKRA